MDRIDVIPYARQCAMDRWTAQPRSTCMRHQRDIGIESNTHESTLLRSGIVFRKPVI